MTTFSFRGDVFIIQRIPESTRYVYTVSNEVLSSSVDFRAPRELWSPPSKAIQYLVNFTGLAGIVNAAIYKTQPIFTGLEHGKLS